jgi:hypothetical protein
MKFQLLNALVLVAGLLVVSTLGEPLLTDSVRLPLQVVAVVLAVVNLLLERMLRPKPGSRPAMLVNKVMMATLIKMGLVLAGILIYVVLDAPAPRHFGIATVETTAQDPTSILSGGNPGWPLIRSCGSP